MTVVSSRSDARDNRVRILEAAREVFAAEGLDVPVREIARRAGVGPATLYRHFPTKEALVAEALAERMRACSAVVEEGLAAADPWTGLREVIVRICGLHARDRGVTAAFLAAYPRAADLAAERERAVSGVAELVRRAREQGLLRPGVGVDDVILLIMANDGVRAATPAARVVASRRFADLAVASLAAPGR